jgi:subtilase family serine protease
VSQSQYRGPRQRGLDGLQPIPAQTVHGTASSPRLPDPIARTVVAILGLTNYGPFGSQAAHTNTSLARPQAGSVSSCVKRSGLPDACHLPSSYAADYGLDPLYQRGANGHGQTVAIVTLAAVDPGGPQHFWSDIAHIPGTGRSLSVVNVDGGPGSPSDAAGSGETDLDVEQSGGLAPGANVVVYQAPNTDYGFADAFFDAASQNVASSVSASWLESETFLRASIADGTESPGYEAAFDEAFLEMAMQGQSGFIATRRRSRARATLQGGWGGTSFVAPQLNGSTAVIDSYLGHRVGFWNPSIYAFADGPGSPFTPLRDSGTGNDNIYYTGNPGQLYNQGSGLGYPNLSRLAADFAASTWPARG